jgi:hypothetical protein
MLAFCKTVYNPLLGCEHNRVTDTDYKVMQDYLRWKRFQNKHRQ